MTKGERNKDISDRGRNNKDISTWGEKNGEKTSKGERYDKGKESTKILSTQVGGASS